MTAQELAALIDSEKVAIAAAVVAEWREIAESEVWHALPPQMSFDDLPEVLRSVACAALLERFERPACEDIIRYSALHGDHRSTEGFLEGYIFTEYHLLRRSLWRFIKDRLEPNAAVNAISRIDIAISLATMAGIRGFHCQTFKARGDWPQALDRLLAEWPMLGR